MVGVRDTIELSTVARKPARTLLLWPTLPLVLPVTFARTAAYRSAALALSAAIEFKSTFPPLCLRYVSYIPFLSCDHLLVGRDMPRTLRLSRRTTPFFGPRPRGNHTLDELSEHHAFRQSRVMRHKPREKDSLLTQDHINALAPRHHEDVDI